MTAYSRWERELPKLLSDRRFQTVPTTKERRAFFDDYCTNAASRPTPVAAAAAAATAKSCAKTLGVSPKEGGKSSEAAEEAQEAAVAEEEAEEGEEIIDRKGPLPQGSAADAFNELLDEAEAAERDEGVLLQP